MRVPNSLYALAFGALCFAACSSPAPEAPAPPPAVDMAALTAQIQALEDAYATAAAAKDAAGVVNYYSDDVVSYSKEKEPARGKEAVRQRLAEGMAKDTTGNTPSFKVVELFVGNDHITEIGTWTDTGTDGQVKDHGTYFSVFKKNGDKWECVRDISVSEMPKKEAASVAAP